MDDDSPIFEWVTCVAYAIATGLMMKIILLPGGALTETHLIDRLAGLAVCVGVFYSLREKTCSRGWARACAFSCCFRAYEACCFRVERTLEEKNHGHHPLDA